jgi:hypothetical protein
VDKELARNVFLHFSRTVGAVEKKVLRHWDEPEDNFVDVVTCKGIYPGSETRAASTVSLSSQPLFLNSDPYPVRVEVVMLGEPDFDDMEHVLATAAFSIIKDGFFPMPGVVIPDIANVYRPQTNLPNIYLSTPFPWDEALHSTKFDGVNVTWLLAFPVSVSETDYLEQHGDEAFEALLESSNSNVFDISRKPII